MNDAAKQRRTPKLTAKVHELYEAEVKSDGWQPGGTVPRIAALTGLTVEQVRDAIWGKSSDEWRRGLHG